MPYATLAESPDITRANIDHYRKMLVGNTVSRARRRILEQLLRSADEMLARMTGTPE
jgi:hypothetical protein